MLNKSSVTIVFVVTYLKNDENSAAKNRQQNKENLGIQEQESPRSKKGPI